MKFFICDIEVSGSGNNLWIEENNIPFMKKLSIKGKNVYKNCFIDKTNIDLIERTQFVNIKSESDLYNEDVFIIYSDGGSFNNGYKDKNLPMFGSTATIVTKNKKEEIWEYSEAKQDVTNNECELMASLYGLRYISSTEDFNSLKRPINIILASDSQYLMKGINEWLAGWKRRGWKNNEGNPTKNIDIWKEIDEDYLTCDDFRIFTCWVRGHQDKTDLISTYNQRCDYLCNVAINDILVENNIPARKIKK